MKSLLFRFRLTGLAQPYACTAAILVDELHAGGFEGAANREFIRRC
jgi:hypothetical protein